MSKSTEGLRSSYRNVVLKGILRIVRFAYLLERGLMLYIDAEPEIGMLAKSAVNPCPVRTGISGEKPRGL